MTELLKCPDCKHSIDCHKEFPCDDNKVDPFFDRVLDDGTILNQYKATLRHPDSTKLKKSKYVPSFPLVDAI